MQDRIEYISKIVQKDRQALLKAVCEHKQFYEKVLDLQPSIDVATQIDQLFQAKKNLIKLGGFKLHSGSTSDWKIDCDNLCEDDIDAIAYLISKKVLFGSVVGIPSGGLRLAEALRKYITKGHHPTLIVDDVLTTGKSMEGQRKLVGGDTTGFVIFARGVCPDWVNAIFYCDNQKLFQSPEEVLLSDEELLDAFNGEFTANLDHHPTEDDILLIMLRMVEKKILARVYLEKSKEGG